MPAEASNTPDTPEPDIHDIPEDEINLFPDDEISRSSRQVDDSKFTQAESPEFEKPEMIEPKVDSKVGNVHQPGPKKPIEHASTSGSTDLPEIEKLTLGRGQSHQKQKEFDEKIEEDKKEACRILSIMASDKQKTARNQHLALACLRDAGINVTAMFAKCDITSLQEFRELYNQCSNKQVELIHKKSTRIPKPATDKVYVIFEETDLKLVAAVVVFQLEKSFEFGDISNNLKELIKIEWSDIKTTRVEPMRNRDELVWRLMILILDNQMNRIDEEANVKMEFVLKFSDFLMKARSEAS